MATTLAQLETMTYSILNDTSTSNVYTTTLIDQLLNDEQVEICDEWDWQFLHKKSLFAAPVDTTLDADVALVDTTITVDATTDWATSGAVRIDHDIITYTGKTSTTITGCSGITVAHEDGAIVEPLTALPSDYNELEALYVQKSTGQSPIMLNYVDEYRWDTDQQLYKYTIVYNNSGTGYLLIDTLDDGDLVFFHYLKSPTTMTSAVDATIPEPYALKILPKRAAAKAMLLFGDNINGVGTDILTIANSELLKMKKQYGERENGFAKRIKSHYQSRISPYSRRYTTRIYE